MNYRIILCLTLLFAMPLVMLGQSNADPEWYTMMKDPKVNYYKAVEVYEKYWEGKKMPPNKDARQTEEYKTFFAAMSVAERQEYERIFLLNKEFKHWRRTEEQWVQPDGHILSLEEKQRIIDQQQRDLQDEEQKNKK
jgi:hypothetical protein